MAVRIVMGKKKHKAQSNGASTGQTEKNGAAKPAPKKEAEKKPAAIPAMPEAKKGAGGVGGVVPKETIRQWDDLLERVSRVGEALSELASKGGFVGKFAETLEDGLAALEVSIVRAFLTLPDGGGVEDLDAFRTKFRAVEEELIKAGRLKKEKKS